MDKPKQNTLQRHDWAQRQRKRYTNHYELEGPCRALENKHAADTNTQTTTNNANNRSNPHKNNTNTKAHASEIEQARKQRHQHHKTQRPLGRKRGLPTKPPRRTNYNA
jgi:hypothetical protein